jgi:hypothetical protein
MLFGDGELFVEGLRYVPPAEALGSLRTAWQDRMDSAAVECDGRLYCSAAAMSCRDHVAQEMLTVGRAPGSQTKPIRNGERMSLWTRRRRKATDARVSMRGGSCDGPPGEGEDADGVSGATAAPAGEACPAAAGSGRGQRAVAFRYGESPGVWVGASAVTGSSLRLDWAGLGPRAWAGEKRVQQGKSSYGASM